MPTHWTRAAADLIFPPTCILCGAPGDDGLDLCAGCRAELPATGVACVRCALPLPEAVLAAGHGEEGPLCGPCRRKPPPFARAHAAFRYEQPLPALVGGLKFRGRLNTLRLMGLLLGESLAHAGGERPAGIVPVPLHPRRLRQRGYDQALELARVVGRALELPVLARCCERTRSTPPQAALEAKARKQNLRGAFRATADLTGAHVAVLDDVVTTGSTVAEVARVLLRAGAGRVDVWCVARTP
ncbi:MAG: ComF family protein [Thiohalocapsa sp.]|uniref:ComF family protein n=1 Tax=Thiohalocapsa sp. TaxID=2497641 RepID=UPI0025DB437A|nr:ComF family protein [Thiohalocapsa sp.]MCG6941097.1 ComF family protein [Thiohalocapsa sp.]